MEIAGYSNDQLAVLHLDGPQSEISYRMAWARTYLKGVGAIDNSARGVWSITEYGRELSEPDMAGIPRQIRARSPRKQRERPGPAVGMTAINGDLPPTDTPELFKSTSFEQWRDKLLEVVQAMTPADFEKLCQRVLRESGFTQVQVTGRSGDGGIDGIGVLRIALLSFHVFFQCKRYKGTVGPSAIRDFRGAMVGRTDKGLFMTTGTFTADAMREATRDGAPVLDLIDGEALCKILKNLSLGVTTRQVEEVSIDAEWFKAI